MQLGTFVTPVTAPNPQVSLRVIVPTTVQRRLRKARTLTMLSLLAAADLAILVGTMVGLTLFVRWAL
jgi:hypothetical protein